MSEEQKFIERARHSLDAHADRLEPHLAARLHEVRRNALASHRRTGHSAWLPALAAASLAVVFVGVVWFGTGTGSGKPEQAIIQANLESGATDFELLTSSEDLELYEKLDFYYWLEQRGAGAG